LFKVGAAKCMNIRGAKKDKVHSKCKGHYCSQSSFILFYSMSILKTVTKINIKILK